MSEEYAEVHHESRSSIELRRDSKGTYGWTVKFYFEVGEEDAALERMKDLDLRLRTQFVENNP